MNLNQLRGWYPTAFHPRQDWFVGHRFMGVSLSFMGSQPPVGFVQGLPDPDELTDATLLAQAYIQWPDAEPWKHGRKVWTADVDDNGYRVYLTKGPHGLEIHRYLAMTTCPHCKGLVTPDDFGVVVWR